MNFKSIAKFVPVPLRARIPFSSRHKNAGEWQQFSEQYRNPTTKLLGNLATLKNTVLVAGCQRSGGTLLTNLISRHASISNYCGSGDQELAGARVLVGERQVRSELGQRFCFQTTYLNEHYYEYLEPYDFKLIWLTRNPKSVIKSMLDNWSHYALEELYKGATQQDFVGSEPDFSVSTLLDKACFSYLAKNDQLTQLHAQLPEYKLMVVDYDDLITERTALLSSIHKFLKLDFAPRTAEEIHHSSIAKAESLAPSAAALIDTRCRDSYTKVRQLRNPI